MISSTGAVIRLLSFLLAFIEMLLVIDLMPRPDTSMYFSLVKLLLLMLMEESVTLVK